MAYKVKDPEFFKKRLKEADQTTEEEGASGEKEKTTPFRAKPLNISTAVDSVLTDTIKLLSEVEYAKMAEEIEKLRENAVRERFTIAVVGDFSRGKSTFLNQLFEREFLPVSNLPTTAVLTRIRHDSDEKIEVFDEKNKKKQERELSMESWEDLTVQNFGGEDFDGEVLVKIHSELLLRSNLEFIDTPGAGDLDETRAKGIGDVLLGCDGAVIVISATSPLSLSEKLFIEERLIARKLPFLLLIITKLDMIPPEERAGVVQYVVNKLKQWKLDIPVYIPYDIEWSETTYDNITGMDKVKGEFARWIANPLRMALHETWVMEKTLDIVNHVSSSLMERKLLAEERDQAKQEALISEKKQKLARAQLVWGDLRIQMQRKCTECCKLLLSQADDYAAAITERLQYEVSHANHLEKWWTEDFPYRVKIELTNMAVGINSAALSQIENDARWYRAAIKQTFQSYILYQRQTIVDKTLFGNLDPGRDIEFENLDRQHTAFKIGSAVLSISGCALFSALGFLPIVATMGVGTGAAIFSEKFFSRKIEAQREELKKEIARCVPLFIRNSMEESERRLEAVYRNMIDEAHKSEQAWLNAQQTSIDNICIQKDGQNAKIQEFLAKLQWQTDTIQSLLIQEDKDESESYHE